MGLREIILKTLWLAPSHTNNPSCKIEADANSLLRFTDANHSGVPLGGFGSMPTATSDGDILAWDSVAEDWEAVAPPFEAAGAISTHTSNADAHHARSHSLTSTSDHTGTLSVAMGGTGSTTADAARTALGVLGLTGSSSDMVVPRFDGTNLAIKSSGMAIADTGALTSTPSGGNARGAGATDLQVTRSVATQVASGDYSTLGGGINCTASGSRSTCAGGAACTASNGYSVVSGGYLNTASGQFSTVCGGAANTASGHYSFAAGRRAKSTATGAFALADSTDADLTNSTADSLSCRFSGGYSFAGGKVSVGELSVSGAWSVSNPDSARTALGVQRWTPLIAATDFSTTAASASTITMNADLTGTIRTGLPVRVTNNGTTYYGMVSAITSGLMTLWIPALNTGSGLTTAVAYGRPEMVAHKRLRREGLYAEATGAITPLNMDWYSPRAYLVAVLGSHESTGLQPVVDIQRSGSTVATITVSATAYTAVSATATSATYYQFSGQTVQVNISTAAAGSTGLTLDLYFVLE